MKDVIKDNLYTIFQTLMVLFLGMGLGAALMDAIKDWIASKGDKDEEKRD